MSETFKLSPSDFGFLYDECKKCFYLKVKHNFDRPRTPMPSIFTKIDGIMKNYFEGKSPKDIADNLPDGKVEFGDKWIQSKPLADKKTGNKCFIKGKTDTREISKQYKVGSDWDLSKTDATVQDGILTVSIPKLEDKKKKVIEIKVK